MSKLCLRTFGTPSFHLLRNNGCCAVGSTFREKSSGRGSRAATAGGSAKKENQESEKGEKNRQQHQRPAQGEKNRQQHQRPAQGASFYKNQSSYTNLFKRKFDRSTSQQQSGKTREKIPINKLIDPKPISIPQSQEGVGEEVTGKLQLSKIYAALKEFRARPLVRKVLADSNINDDETFDAVYRNFRQYIRNNMAKLPADFHVVLTDITEHKASVDGLIKYFLDHASKIYPHLEYMEDLKKEANLQKPANWYVNARDLNRKIIYHAGPTNSGKTYHALQRFMQAKRAMYCGPLRLLAQEVFMKTNAQNIPCDLITGEEVKIVDPDGNHASHVSCTVEIASTREHYDVAVIDEIQMIRDSGRGSAWTRALLGLYVDEIHVCGEQSAIPVVRKLLETTGDQFEIRNYNRLTSLSISECAVGSLSNIQPGDCIVAFSKKDIYKICLELERLNIEAAVIYGSLPPATKRAQAEIFNDPENSCNVMVATDAVGMGINLNIKRIVFYSLTKLEMVEQKNGPPLKEMKQISTSQALQIAGRAGRFGTVYADGEVTTFKHYDYELLKAIMKEDVEPVLRAGLTPSPEQLQMFSYYLGEESMLKILDAFHSLTTYDQSDYFLCDMDDFRQNCELLEDVDITLRDKYTFCTAPAKSNGPFTMYMFKLFARNYSKGIPTTFEIVLKRTGHPYKYPETVEELSLLEDIHNTLDLYVWLSYRFRDMFPEQEQVMALRDEIEPVIRYGVQNITKLGVPSNQTTQATNQTTTATVQE